MVEVMGQGLNQEDALPALKSVGSASRCPNLPGLSLAGLGSAKARANTPRRHVSDSAVIMQYAAGTSANKMAEESEWEARQRPYARLC